jgi:5'-3' exonuclease
VLYTLIKERKGKYDRAMVYALDNDLLQVAGDIDLGGRVFYAKLKDTSVPFEGYCSEKYDVHPRDLVLFRALIGDSSDNLKGPVPRFPRALARKLVVRYSYKPNPAEELMQDLNCLPQEVMDPTERKWLSALIQRSDVFLTNYKMMKLQSLKLADMTSYFRDPQKDVEYFVRGYGLNTLQKIKDGTFRRPTDEGSNSHFNPNRPY